MDNGESPRKDWIGCFVSTSIKSSEIKRDVIYGIDFHQPLFMIERGGRIQLFYVIKYLYLFFLVSWICLFVCLLDSDG